MALSADLIQLPSHRTRVADQAAIAAWLAVMVLLVLAMVVVGGATRLTDSGLSITEWQPILGAIPPLSDAEWNIALEKYRQIPEYREINRGMSMEAFQFIFWWEWGHRFLGRIIGLVFAIGLVVFWWRGSLPSRLKPWLVGLLLLGGLQGFVGWYMVQSGLVERVDVSQYRLALHLSIAFVILALLVWVRQQVTADTSASATTMRTVPRSQLWLAAALVVFILLQAAIGGFVAGTKAGLIYNTWPLMDGEFVPSGLFMLTPWWLNAFENHTAIQFNHRIAAYVILVAALVHAVVLAATSDAGSPVRSGAILAAAIVAQAGLGIWTLLAAEGEIPIGLGLAHQGGAAVVLAIAVWHWDRLARSGTVR